MLSRLLIKKERHILKKSGEYFEGHHIIPKYLGGSGCSSRGFFNDNIVYLSAREHFLAHWLFWRIKRDRQSSLAFHKMLSCNKNQNRIKSSYAFQEARESYIKTNLGNKFSLGKKKTITQEQKDNLSKKMKGKRIGNENPFYQKKHDAQTKKIMSEKAKLRIGCLSSSNKGVRIVYKNGEELGQFATNEEVSLFTGCSIYGIKNVLGGSQKTTGGFIIKYKIQ